MFVVYVQVDRPCPTDGHRKCSLSDNQEKCHINHTHSTQKAVSH